MISGNGIFCYDNIWDETNVKIYFDPKGQEKIFALDMISVKGGYSYLIVADIDGFIHKNAYDIPPQCKPNMGKKRGNFAYTQDLKNYLRMLLYYDHFLLNTIDLPIYL
jgi:hypothetical protein